MLSRARGTWPDGPVCSSLWPDLLDSGIERDQRVGRGSDHVDNLIKGLMAALAIPTREHAQMRDAMPPA